MEFRVLGPLELVGDDGRSIKLPGGKPRLMLALLLLEDGRLVSVDRLVAGLWGERPPATAGKVVQGYVSRLRKLLPEGLLETQAAGYRLRLEEGQLDLDRFERLRREGTAAAVESRHEAAAELLASAISLWRGSALADLADELRLPGELARLDELRLATVEERIDAELALGHEAEVVAELEAFVARHPLRERARGQLMLALYRDGRQADALAVYQKTRSLLVDELGLDPSRPLQQLEQAILHQDPSLELADGTAVPPAAPDVRSAAPARKTVSVLVCDVVDFNLVGERLDPESRVLLISRYIEMVAAVLARHGGTIEKFVGDALMAVFGVPLLHEDDAVRAVRAAAELHVGLEAFNRGIARDYGTTLELRIGINTGEVVTGAEERLASGDAVNVAAQLQQAAAPGEILLSHETLTLARHTVEVEELEPLEQQVKTGGIVAYRLTLVPPDAPRRGRRFEVPMVGRVEELKLLADGFANLVRRRSCGLYTVLGAAGIGKSRLAQEFLAGVEATVVAGRCLSYGEGITYWPVVEVVRQLGGPHEELLAESPGAAAAIDALLGDSAASTSEEIAWAVRKLLEASAVDRPLVVVFDDVHWGEVTFLELVEHVAYLSRDAPILLLCLARPELLDRRPGWASGNLNGATTTLEPLNTVETDELIERLPGGDKLPPALAARIRAAADGNPLFVEEMLAMVLESDQREVIVPPTIKALLAARLDQLDPAERAVLGRGSVEGQLFHRGAVEAMTMPPTPAERQLVELVRKQLVRPDRPQLPAEDAYRFRHLLIRDAAYDALPKATRAELHERFADWLDQEAHALVERDELVGYHLEQAHRYRKELGQANDANRTLGERAANRLAAGADRAASRSDFEAVANLLERALALGIADPRERVRLEFDLGFALSMTRHPVEADAVLAATCDVADRLGERGVAARARVQRVWNQTGLPELDFAEGQVIAERAIETLTELGDERGLVLAHRLLGLALARKGQSAEVGAEFERAVEHAEHCGDREMQRAAINTLANHYLCNGPTPAAEAIVRCEELLGSARGDRVLEATVMRPLALFHSMAARPDEALELLRQSSLVLDELNLRNMEVHRWVAAYARELAGDRLGAEQELKSMWLYFCNLRGDAIDTRGVDATAELARLYCDEGRWDEAAEMTSYWSGLRLRDGTTPRATRALALEGRLKAHRGRAVEAVTLLEPAIAAAEARQGDLTLRAQIWHALAEVRRTAGRPAEADAAAATAIELYEKKGNVSAADRLRLPARS